MTAAPRVWPVFLAYGLVLGALLTGPGLVLLFMAAVQHGPAILQAPDRLPRTIETLAYTFPGLTAIIAVNALLVSGAALAPAALSPTPLRARLGLGASALPWGAAVGAVIGTLALSQALDALVVLVGLERVGFLARFRDLLQGLPAARVAVLGIVLSLLPGVAEEVFFRGYAQTRLVARWGAARGIVATALLFGFLHLDPVQSPLAAVLGAYLGYVAFAARSVWPAIACHVANNAVAVLTAALVGAPASRALNLGLFLGGLALAGLALLGVRRWAGRPAPAPSPVP